MSMREMRSDDRDRREQRREPDASGANLDHIRQAGSTLLRAGADAINRALSGNSRAFLEATRQQGGE